MFLSGPSNTLWKSPVHPIGLLTLPYPISMARRQRGRKAEQTTLPPNGSSQSPESIECIIPESTYNIPRDKNFPRIAHTARGRSLLIFSTKSFRPNTYRRFLAVQNPTSSHESTMKSDNRAAAKPINLTAHFASLQTKVSCLIQLRRGIRRVVLSAGSVRCHPPTCLSVGLELDPRAQLCQQH